MIDGSCDGPSGGASQPQRSTTTSAICRSRRLPTLWELLLEGENTNSDTVETVFDRARLSSATGYGYWTVRLLLEREDINPNAADTIWSNTSLLGCGDPETGVIKLLLERNHVNSDMLDLSGERALELAASRGHPKVVELPSEPQSSLLVPINTGGVPGHPLPDPSNLPQSPSQSIPSVCLSRSEPLSPDTRPSSE